MDAIIVTIQGGSAAPSPSRPAGQAAGADAFEAALDRAQAARGGRKAHGTSAERHAPAERNGIRKGTGQPRGTSASRRPLAVTEAVGEPPEDVKPSAGTAEEAHAAPAHLAMDDRGDARQADAVPPGQADHGVAQQGRPNADPSEVAAPGWECPAAPVLPSAASTVDRPAGTDTTALADAPQAVAPAQALPTGTVARDASAAVREAGDSAVPPAKGAARTVAAAAPAVADGADVLPPEAAEIDSETARSAAVPDAPPVRGRGAAPAGAAYLRAVRALDDAGVGTMTDTGHLPRAAAVRSAQPDPAGVNGDNRTQPTSPARSARAVEVLRSLGFLEVGAREPDVRAAQPLSPVADVMTGVAMELAAANTGNGERDAEDPAWASGRHPPRTAAAVESLAQAPTLFSIPAGQSAATPLDAPAAPVESPGAAVTPQGPPLGGQVVKAIALAWRDGVGEARIRLSPEHLGEVLVSMKIERGQVMAHVAAETATARAWIESHQQELRDNLSQQGLHLDRLVVTDDGQRQQQPQGDGTARHRRPRQRGGANGPRFELTA